mgnify:CR=1 FL=1
MTRSRRSFVDLVFLVLAARRATRLLTADVITEPLRVRAFKRWPSAPEYSRRPLPGYDPILDASNPGAAPAMWWRDATTTKGKWLAKMLGCPRWCASIWAATAVVFLDLVPGARVLVRVLALSESTAWLHEAAEWGLPPARPKTT